MQLADFFAGMVITAMPSETADDQFVPSFAAVRQGSKRQMRGDPGEHEVAISSVNYDFMYKHIYTALATRRSPVCSVINFFCASLGNDSSPATSTNKREVITVGSVTSRMKQRDATTMGPNRQP